MKDYWLHMVMFNYCHTKFPDVKYSMHAGELTLGLVQPEDLTSHINAVYTAGANRIGHGVDMAYESKSYELLRYMAKKQGSHRNQLGQMNSF
jgi:adenosine deaminase